MSNNQEDYSVDRLKNDISNVVLITTNFVSDWKDADATRYASRGIFSRNMGRKYTKTP